MDSNVKWYDPDLRKRLELCVGYVSALLDKDKKDEPFFGVTRLPDGTARAHHGIEIGIPHVTGRAIDTIFGIENTTGIKTDGKVIGTYINYLYSCCDLEDYLPVFYHPEKAEGRPLVEFHNLRECLEALVWLIKTRKDSRALKVTEGFLKTIDSLTNRETGRYDAELLKNLPPEKAEKFAGLCLALPVGQGRLVGPLMLLYNLTGNTLALRLAGGYARSTMALCFDENGLIMNAAANHVHSITSTMSGVLCYALSAGDRVLYEKVKKVYENGLRNAYSSYGYCKEQLWIPSEQGESNQVGDLIQVQLMLAECESPALWYSRAEKFMRGGILPAQVLSTDGYVKNIEDPKTDEEYKMAERAIGGFGFPNPSCHLNGEHCEIDTIDITQGAAQGICAFMEKIVTKTPLGTCVNLMFDADTEYARIESALPVEGSLKVTVRTGGSFLIRIPQNIEEGSFKVASGGGLLDYENIEGYAVLGSLRPGTSLNVSFSPRRFKQHEYICHKLYEVEWFGEQVIGVSPEEGIYPLFGQFPL